MSNPHQILVTGATGRQGGAVAKHLLSRGFRVKALTRNPKSKKAAALESMGAEIVQGDLNKPLSYTTHLEDLYGIYSVQTFANGVTKEIAQGIQLANQAKAIGISHFVYASAVGTTLNTGIPHWESKRTIEQHVKSIGIPYTIVKPSSFYENLLVPQVQSGIYKGNLGTPLKNNTKQYSIAVDDIGAACATIFSQTDSFLEKEITLANELLSSDEMASVLSDTLGISVKYQKMPSLITRIFLGKNLYQMFKWIDANESTLSESIAASKDQSFAKTQFRQWVQQNFVKK